MRRKERKTLNITKTQVKPNAIKAHQRNQTPVCTHRRIYHGWIPNVFLLACIQPTCSWSPFLPLLSSARRAGGRPHPPLQAEAIQEGQELRYMQAGHHQGGTHLQRWVSGKFDPPPSLGVQLQVWAGGRLKWVTCGCESDSFTIMFSWFLFKMADEAGGCPSMHWGIQK